jgi:hypothetical protein
VAIRFLGPSCPGYPVLHFRLLSNSSPSASLLICPRDGRYNPISIDTFDEEVSSLFYGQQTASLLSDEPIMYHRLSLMFMVLAIGSLMDMSLPAYNMEAEKYHQLARAALFHSSLFDEPTLNAVQSLVIPFRSHS